jgi:hypothetical protein
MGDLGKELRVGILLRIRGEDALDAVLGHQDRLGVDLQRAQRGGRVGGEERIAGAGREDHHPALLQVADGPPADVGLGHRPHLDRRQHARLAPGLLERVLQGEGVDDGCQHAHVVRGGALHAASAGRDPTEDVAPADDDRQLHAQLGDLAQLGADPHEHRRIEAVALTPGQRLSRELEDYAAVHRAPTARLRRHG